MDRAVIERCLRAAHLARQTDRLVRRHQAVFWLFGGLWVNVSGRRQPRDGAARAEPGFPTKREVATEGGRQYTMVVEALVPLDAARGATVYTNAPKRLRDAVLANLCTLLRPPPTAVRTTGRGHGSHDIDGPMAPVMPGRSNLRLAPPERWRNHPPTRTHEAPVFSSHFLLSWDEKMR